MLVRGMMWRSVVFHPPLEVDVVLRRALSTTLALVLALGMAGCGSGPPSSTPTPIAPGPVLTPAPSPDMDALYAEAERVVREAMAIEEKYLMDLDNTQYPPELSEFYADPYREAHEQLLARSKERGVRLTPDPVVVWDFQPAPEELIDGAEVAMWVCKDSSGAPGLDESGEVAANGIVSMMLYYFKQVDGRLMLYFANSFSEVESCPPN
jgi:hypothetical protein